MGEILCQTAVGDARQGRFDHPNKISTARTLAKHQENVKSIELHTFGDANNKGVSQALVAGKSRLAKQRLTIARLQLVSAYMAANLVSKTQEALDGFPVIRSHG